MDNAIPHSLLPYNHVCLQSDIPDDLQVIYAETDPAKVTAMLQRSSWLNGHLISGGLLDPQTDGPPLYAQELPTWPPTWSRAIKLKREWFGDNSPVDTPTLRQQLMAVAWHPKRILSCLHIEEVKEFERPTIYTQPLCPDKNLYSGQLGC
jgi:hypothetical protein